MKTSLKIPIWRALRKLLTIEQIDVLQVHKRHQYLQKSLRYHIAKYHSYVALFLY